jgi:SARP family transcriptional regulator, regulator of embCAB operon
LRIRGTSMHGDKLHIRVLGDLRVTRCDGTDVQVEEWRTGKTRDLLRLLALGDGRPVRADRLTEQLWPEAPSHRARNRLRTAVSQIRMTLGDHSVKRHPDGYLLTDFVLDAHQFAAMAVRAGLAVDLQDHAAVLPITRAAERLYRDDFHADDDDSSWAVAERTRLQRLRRTMARDATEAALQEQHVREALSFATLAVELDPMNETAHRLLMRAHAAMGEIAAALRDFEDYRSRLAEELGVDPSPQTRALHVELLRESSTSLTG